MRFGYYLTYKSCIFFPHLHFLKDLSLTTRALGYFGARAVGADGVNHSQRASLRLCSSPRVILGVTPLYESRDELLGFRCRTTSILPARTCPEFCSCLHNAGLSGPVALSPRSHHSSQSPLMLCEPREDGASGASSLQTDATRGGDPAKTSS